MGFVANFIRFPAVQKFWTPVKIWQGYRELNGGNFFWDTVYISNIHHSGIPSKDAIQVPSNIIISLNRKNYLIITIIRLIIMHQNLL